MRIKTVKQIALSLYIQTVTASQESTCRKLTATTVNFWTCFWKDDRITWGALHCLRNRFFSQVYQHFGQKCAIYNQKVFSLAFASKRRPRRRTQSKSGIILLINFGGYWTFSAKSYTAKTDYEVFSSFGYIVISKWGKFSTSSVPPSSALWAAPVSLRMAWHDERRNIIGGKFSYWWVG